VPKRALPAPEQFTTADLMRIILGVLMIPLGLIIFVRTLSAGATALAVLVGAVFVTFGVYRLWLAWSRYGLYRRSKR